MGAVQYYVLHIYPDRFLQTYLRALRDSARFGILPTVVSTDTNQLEGAVTDDPRALLFPQNLRRILKAFQADGSLELKVPPDRVAFVDVPVPPGSYYLAYSIQFAKFGWAFPLYSDRLNPTVRWGPPALAVDRDTLIEVSVSPTTHLAFPVPNEFRYSATPPFWDYVRYLVANGVVH